MGIVVSAAGLGWATMLRQAAHAIDRRCDELTALDQVVGDGDHGINLQAGFAATTIALDQHQDPTSPEVLAVASEQLQVAMAGTAGLLLGRFFHAASRAIDDSLTAASVAAALRAGTAEVAKRGRVAVGDRSMFDAWEPAAAAAEASAASNTTVAVTLAAAARAAERGAESTSGLVPRVGRAARASQTSTGQPDAGATSVAIILRSWAETAETSEADE